jgi:hypothetical protein
MGWFIAVEKFSFLTIVEASLLANGNNSFITCGEKEIERAAGVRGCTVRGCCGVALVADGRGELILVYVS